MGHKYERFNNDFKKRVADEAKKPDLYKGKPQVMMPEDDDDAVADFFKSNPADGFTHSTLQNGGKIDESNV